MIRGSSEGRLLERRDREQDWLFAVGSLRDIIPEDHILRRVDRVLDLSWLRNEVRELYDEKEGRPGIDPEAAVRLMLAGFFHGIVHDRKLLREAQVNIAIRWFAGYQLHEKLPDHSSLTRIRQRWGTARFKKIFERTVADCVAQGLVTGETVHIDATLIRANASMDSLGRVHADAVLKANAQETSDPNPEPEPSSGASRPGSRKADTSKAATVRSSTDPDATLAKGAFGQPARPCYKQHTAVDDRAQIIVDVAVTTGAVPEEQELLPQLARIEQRLGKRPAAATTDTQYGITTNYAALEEREIRAIIPPQTPCVKSGLPIRAFKFDARHDLFQCPHGRKLRYKGRNERQQRVYRSGRKDCANCPLRSRCCDNVQRVRTLKVNDGYPALLRARRRHLRREAMDRMRLRRHRWQVEGVHGEAKQQHGLGRAVRRGLWNIEIQAYLTAAVMNLKRLAREEHTVCAFAATPHATLRIGIPRFVATELLVAA